MSASTDNLHKKILLSTIFAVAMAYLESAVVVYLREIYYPNGFHFPLSRIDRPIMLTEIGREAATIVMLYAYARTIGRNRRETFAYFALNFGIWDIWYYLWLKILINWPVSLMEWDVLFLIPVPWFGPVLAPVLVSSALIVCACIVLVLENRGKPLQMRLVDWLLVSAAGLLIIWSFIPELKSVQEALPPQGYAWWVFALGLCGGLLVFFMRVMRGRTAPHHKI
jgi:hypothetical protein